METPTPFDLNEALQRWRSGLSQLPQWREEDLTELEAHLRDGVAAWQARGLTEEEAFLLAARRLGCPGVLEPEFAKINRRQIWLDRLLWMLVGVQLLALVGTVSHVVADAAVFGGLAGVGYHYPTRFGTPNLLPAALLSGANLLALAGAIAGVCWWVRRKASHTRQVLSQLLRRPLVAGLLLGAFMLAIPACSSVEGLLFTRLYATSALGSVYITKSLSGSVLQVIQTVALTVLTIRLLRRRWALNTEAVCRAKGG